MRETIWLAMPPRGWVILLAVLVAMTGCAAGGEANDTGAPGTQPSLAAAAPRDEAQGASQAVSEATRTPNTASIEPEPTPAPTLTPTVVTPPAPLAALVNGEYVFLADYQRKVARYQQTLVDQGLDPKSEAGQAQLAQMRQDVIEGMIDFALIEQGASNLGLGLGTGALQDAMDAGIAAGGGEVAFEEWLKATDQSRDEYREMLRQALLSQMVLEALTAAHPEATESDTSPNLLVAVFEQWLAGQRESAVIERFVGD